MTSHTKYHGIDQSGRIVSLIACLRMPPGFQNIVSPGGVRYIEAIDGTSKETHWYNLATQQFELLKNNPSSIDGHTLSNVPAPCVIVVNKRRFPCDDTSCEIEGLESGPHIIRVEAAGYKDAVFEVVV